MPKENSSTSEGEPKRNQHGGDRSSPQAKADAAKRVEQIVALRLRGYTFGAISNAVGITESAAQKSFMAALVRNSDETLETYHRAELLALELQQAEIWRVIDGVENQNDYRVVASCMNRLNRIHVRRARLLGLDAPKTLNDQAILSKCRHEQNRESLITNEDTRLHASATLLANLVQGRNECFCGAHAQATPAKYPPQA